MRGRRTAEFRQDRSDSSRIRSRAAWSLRPRRAPRAHRSALRHRLVRQFFADLEIRQPDVNLGIGSGNHAEQTARVLMAFDAILPDLRPDVVIVVGDVNSTLACALAASKRLISVAHVEAGLRSGDRTMPEEINRLLTDAISDLLFTTSLDANRNLLAEGVAADKMFFVGNVMIDSLLRSLPRAIRPAILDTLRLQERQFAVVTLHRPSNVDRREDATTVLDVLEPVQEHLPIIFPMHPRSRQMFERHGLGPRLACMRGLHLVDPLGYLEFLYLLDRARLVLTDSGGVQEETTLLGVPCLTLRPNTERPITIIEGTNRLVGLDQAAVIAAVNDILADRWSPGRRPDLWDGQAAGRIVEVILERCAK